MKVHAIFNSDGGTFRTLDMAVFSTRAGKAFAEKGRSFTCDAVTGPKVENALKKAVARDDIDALIVGGGDGTISTAARLAWRSGMTIGIVPAGTMNLFARALGMPLDIFEALDMLATASERKVDIASVNDTAFVHQFSVGLHPRMVRLRNASTFASRLGKIRASVGAAFSVIADPPTFRAQISVDGETEERRVSAISVSNNLFGDNPLLVPARLDAGRLGVYIAPALKSSGAARLAMDMLAGRMNQNPDLDGREASRVTVSFPKLRQDAQMLLDGELYPLEKEVEIAIHPGELSVLAPEPTAQEAPPA